MNKSSQTIERKFPIELRIVVWEFVRIMVQLEKSTKSKNHKNSLSIYHAWLPAWHEIDDRLTESGKKDASEFSELMMEKEVLLQCRSNKQLNELYRVLENVINQLKVETRLASGNAEKLTSLRYEKSELETLLRKTRRMRKSPNRNKR